MLEAKDEEIEGLVSRLAKNDKDLMEERSNYETRLETIEQKLKDLQGKREQFDNDKKSLEEKIRQQEEELARTKTSLEQIADKNIDSVKATSAQIEELQTKLKEQGDKLSKTKSEKDTLERANSSAQEESKNVQKERNDLKEKLTRLNYLGRVFSELRGVGIKQEQIKNTKNYKSSLRNALSKQAQAVQSQRQKVWTNLVTLIGQNSRGQRNYESSKLEKEEIIGNKDKEDQFLKDLRDLLDSIEKR